MPVYNIKKQQTGSRQVNEIQKDSNAATDQIRLSLKFLPVEIQSVDYAPAKTTAPAWTSPIVDTQGASLTLSSLYKLTFTSEVQVGDVIVLNMRLLIDLASGVSTWQAQVLDGMSQKVLPGTYINWGTAGFQLFPLTGVYTMKNTMKAGTCTVGLYASSTGVSTTLPGTSMQAQLLRKFG